LEILGFFEDSKNFMDFWDIFSHELQGFFNLFTPCTNPSKIIPRGISHYLILGPSNKGTTRKIMVKVENVEFASDLFLRFLIDQFLIT